jgi:hypothetical protein
MDRDTRPQRAVAEPGAAEPWYVYDRYSHLLHISDSLQRADSWIREHWGHAEVASRQDLAANDYWYLLRTAQATPSDFHDADRQASEYQARVIRRDRVVAIGRNPDDQPATPDPDLASERA